MSWIKRWLMGLVWTVSDVGEDHGKNGYPNDMTFVEIPLYALKPPDGFTHPTVTEGAHGHVVKLDRGLGHS